MFGNNLKKYRQKKGYSQSELASKLYVTRQCVSKWEKGVTEPDMETLVRISELLDVSVDILLREGVNDGEKKSKDINSHFLILNALIALFCSIGYVILWRFVSPTIPAHWTNGKIDRYGSSAEIFLHLLTVVTFLAVDFFSYILLRRANIKKVVYFAHSATLLAQIAYYIFILVMYVGYLTTFYSFATCMCVNMILCISIAMHPKIFKQNHLLGIRTTDTLKSETVWKKTNALGCYLFVLFSFVILAVIMTVNLKYPFILLIAYIVPAIVVIIYSKCISKVTDEDNAKV